jgi:hypothetical protein
MTLQPSQHPTLSLAPATLTAMLRTTIDTLPHHPDAPEAEQAVQRRAAFEVIAALRPRDALEALLAARVVAAHYHTMDAFRCAAQRDLPINLLLRYQGKAIALSRLMTTTLRDLDKRQAGPALQPEALPAEVPAARARPAQPTAPVVTPPSPPPVRVEAKPAIVATAQAGQPAPAARANGPIQAGLSDAMRQHILNEIAARAAASSTAIAA